MSKFILAPSIIASDFTHLADEIAACESAGADWLHVDVMDGHFVPTITVGPLFVEACKRATKLPLDIHLMISNPDQYLEVFAKAGANNITVHVETCPNLLETVAKIKSLGCIAGITLNPAVPALALDKALPLADLVLVMSVNAGYSGQAFIPEMIVKVKEIRNKLDALRSNAYLEVDGGINVDTLPLMYKAGARVFVSGTAAFKNPQGVEDGIRQLRGCLLD
jgi:ribulose-phosphate 3-epimerase